MATTMTARPNHYELLGLPPTASTDEIFAAFRKAMGLFAAPPSAVAAQLSVAFETLRNPDKRRAYDEANGLNAKTVPEPAPMPKPVGAGFIASASHDAAARALRDKLAKLAAPAAIPATGAEARLGSLIASSVRGEGGPWPAAGKARLEPNLERAAAPVAAAPVAAAAVAPVAPPGVQEAAIAEGSPLEWRRPALIAGGLVAAAALVGALAGVSVRDDPAPKAAPAAKARVTVPLPSARPAEATPPSAPAVAESQVATSSALPTPARAAPPKHRPARPEAVVVADSVPTAPPPLESAIADSTPEAPPAAPQAASSSSLPLPKAVIARTIQRIGYSCGSVVSTTAVDGAPGVYTISCSSGQSYQARPVRGRYHFRRLGKP